MSTVQFSADNVVDYPRRRRSPLLQSVVTDMKFTLSVDWFRDVEAKDTARANDYLFVTPANLRFVLIGTHQSCVGETRAVR